MARPQDTPSLTIPTDLDIAGSGIVFREVRKTWMKAARADIRLELQKGLKARNLGLPDVDIRKFRLNYNTVHISMKNMQKITYYCCRKVFLRLDCNDHILRLPRTLLSRMLSQLTNVIFSGAASLRAQHGHHLRGGDQRHTAASAETRGTEQRTESTAL